MSQSLVIVGGGVIGLCAAYYAMRKGHRVTVLERAGSDHDSCVLGSAGYVSPSHFVPLAAPGMVAKGLRMMWNPESPFYIRPRLDWDLWNWCWKFYRASNASQVARAAPLMRDLTLASRTCFEELSALPGNEFGLVKKGLLTLCKTERTFHHEAELAEQSRRLGMPAEVLSAQQTAKLEPNIRMNIVGAAYFPLDCHLSPQRFMAGLTRQLEAGGVQFSWSTEVTGWQTRGKRIEAIRTTRGDLTADEYVVAGGSWSPGVVRGLGLKLPLQAGKGYSLTLPKPKCTPAISCILVEARVAVTPIGSSLRFGGTMEIAGLDESLNPARVQGIMKSVPQYFPEFGPEDFRDVTPWRGLRPCSPDGLPYVGRFARYENLSVGTGHAMMGLSLGPITGKLIAEILSGEPASISTALLNPDRYA